MHKNKTKKKKNFQAV